MKTMKEQRKAKRSFWQGLIGFFERGWFAPFLLSIQPVLNLFSINTTEVSFSETLRSILVALLFGSLVLGLAYLFTRTWRKASPIASLVIFLFFLFGDLSSGIVRAFGLGPARADLLVLLVVAACTILWIWLVQKRIRNIASVNLYFNLLGLLFLLKSGIPAAGNLAANSVSFHQDGPAPVAVAQSADPRPDIYYIILDGYGRKDILQSLYDFDNSAFVDGLRARGFYVADQSSSNYIQTALSLSSSLNMDYLQSLKAEGTRIEGRADLIRILEHSRVRTILAQNGYQMVSFRNEYKATVPDAEIYYDDDRTGFARPVTAFESILIDQTMVRALTHWRAFNEALVGTPYDTHRHYILTALSDMQKIPGLDGDYFVYAHIIAPHPPFVFDQNGKAVPHDEPFTLFDANYYIRDHSRKSYIAGYRRQIQYVNTLVLKAIDDILAHSRTPPIIIIQGDHGPGAYLHWGSLEHTVPAERFSILNAYYFPDQDYSALYPSISPVNSFRVLLDQFFGSTDEILPDRHYYSSWSFPLDFTEVTDLSLPQLQQH